MKHSGLHDYVLNDLFADIPGVTSRAMFGGYGFYKEGLIFAIIADEKLYFKVNETNKSDYESRGSEPFTYTAHTGKRKSMAYWEVPADVMEDRDVLPQWVEKSVAVSQTARR